MKKTVFSKMLSVFIALAMLCAYLPVNLSYAAGDDDVEVGKGSGTTYYVANNGSDENDGKSIDKPMQTLYAVGKKLAAGDTLLIRGGDYADYFLLEKKGATKDDHLVIKNYKDEKVVIHKGDNEQAAATKYHSAGWTNLVVGYIVNSTYVDMSGLEFNYENDEGDGMDAQSGMAALAVYQSSNIDIHDCIFRAAGDGVYLRNACTNINFHNNIISENVSTGIDIREACGPNIKIYNNIFRDQASGTSAFAAHGTSSTVDVFNNLFYDNQGNAVHLYDGADKINVYNNTMQFNNTDAVLDAKADKVAAVGTANFNNNIMTTGVTADSGDVTTDYNLYTGTPVNTLGAHDATTSDVKFLNVDESDKTARDFHIVAGSPAIRAGNPTICPETDFDGLSRMTPADIGAFACGMVYFVSSTDGDDNNSGTQASPLKTLATASSKLRSGDSLAICAGEYDNDSINITSVGSKDSAPVTIYPADAGKVTLKGGNSVVVTNSYNVDIYGLKFDGDMKTPAVRLNNVNKASFHDCSITNSDVGLYIDGGTANSTFYNNEFSNAGGKDIYLRASDSNNFYNNVLTGYYGIYADQAFNNTMFSNNMFKTSDYSVSAIPDGVTGTTFQNNIFYGSVIPKDGTTFNYNCYTKAIPTNGGENSIIGEPTYDDSYNVARSSVTVDKGTDVKAPSVDKKGTKRYNATDIGPFEYVVPNIDVKSYSPTGTGISNLPTISVTFTDEFTKEADSAYFAKNITLKDADNNAVDVTTVVGTYEEGKGTTVTLTPVTALAFKTKYTVTISKDLANKYGDVLGQDFTWNFEVGTDWGAKMTHPSLAFGVDDLPALRKKAADQTQTTFGISAKSFNTIKTNAVACVDAKCYTDRGTRGAGFVSSFYMYYPYMLQPVDWSAKGSMRVGDNSTLNAFATRSFTASQKKQYYINFDYEPIDPEKAEDYVIWSGKSADGLQDVILENRGGKLFYTNGSESTFLEQQNFTFRSAAWYNFFIAVDENAGTVNVVVDSLYDRADITATQFGNGAPDTIVLGNEGSGKGMAHYDNMRIYDTYAPIVDDRFDNLVGWTLSAGCDKSSEAMHAKAYPVYYWTAMTADLRSNMQNMAFTYLMLADSTVPSEQAIAQKCADKAKQMLLSLAHWNQWTDPEEKEDASLDLSYTVLGVSYTYDMIYDTLNSEDRVTISNAIKKLGVDQLYKACSNPNDRVNHYDGNSVPTNSLFVQSSALGVCSLVVGKEVDTTKELNLARYNIEESYKFGLDEDGAWNEGFEYGDLALGNALQFHDADARITGHDVIHSGYLTKIIDYFVYGVFPGKPFTTMVSDNALYSYQYNKIMLYYSKNNLSQYAAWGLKRLNFSSAGDFLPFIWSPGEVTITSPSNDKTPLGKIFNGQGTTFLKTGWGPTDTLADIKSSKRTNGALTDHTHLDQNTIELVRNGSQLLIDPGYQSWSGPTTTFNQGTLGHNTFVLDGKSQNSFGFGGQIENFFINDKYGYSVSNAGNAYMDVYGMDGVTTPNKDNIPEWRRNLVDVIGGGYYVMFDDYQTNEDNRDLKWQLHTAGKVSNAGYKNDNGSTLISTSLDDKDSLGIRFMNSDMSKVKTEDDIYSGQVAVTGKGFYVSIPKSKFSTAMNLTLTVKADTYATASLNQTTNAATTTRLGTIDPDLDAKGNPIFPSKVNIKEYTFKLDKDYKDSIADNDTVDIYIGIGTVFIESISVTDETDSYTVNSSDDVKAQDTIDSTRLSITYSPDRWRDPITVDDKVLRGSQGSENIYMRAPNGKENHNILTLLYPFATGGQVPDTRYLSDGDDTGLVLSRDGKVDDGVLDGTMFDVVLFHKDSVTPTVLSNARHATSLGSVPIEQNRLMKVVIEYKADKDCTLMQDGVAIGTLKGDGTKKVDTYTLYSTNSPTATLSTDGAATVSDVWSSGTEKITDATVATNYEVSNPDSYYDSVISYKGATKDAVVKQNDVIIGHLPEGDGTKTIRLQKPYVETVDSVGARHASVNITLEGATAQTIKLVENEGRSQFGKTLLAGDSNDTAFSTYYVPGVCIRPVGEYYEVADGVNWGARTTEDGVTVRKGTAGAQMYVNSMNKRNLFRTYFKYKSEKDVPVYQYSDSATKVQIGTLPGGKGWQIASCVLKGYTTDFDGWNMNTNRVIEFGSDITLTRAWLELAATDKQVDLNDLTKDTATDFTVHSPGITVASDFGSVKDGYRVASAGAKFYATVDDLANTEYTLNMTYTADKGGTISQGGTVIGTYKASSDPVTIQATLSKDAVDALTDKSGTNIELTLSSGANVSVMSLDMANANTNVETFTSSVLPLASVVTTPTTGGSDVKTDPVTPNGPNGPSGPSDPSGPSNPEPSKTTLTPVAKVANNIATATLAEKDITDAITEAAESKADIVIAPTVTGAAATQTVEIPTATIATAAGKIASNLVVKTGDATVTIPNSALKALGSGMEKTTAITTAKQDDGSIKVSVTVGGKDVEVAGLTAAIVAKPVTAGTVAILVGADGKESIIKNSVVADGSVIAKIAEGSTIKVEDKTKSFTDINSHWGKDYINFATSRELFAGLTDTTFGPDVKMTRGMFVTVLGRYAEGKADKDAGFADIASGEYYTDYVNWAAENGIVNGVSAGQFAPNATITREQLCVMIANYAKSANISLASDNTADFSDGDKISSWASDAVTAMAKAGVIKGRDDGSFDPQGQASRAEVATILQNFITAYVVK